VDVVLQFPWLAKLIISDSLQGNELNATLGLKPSQLTKYLMLEVVRWQLDNPSGTAEDCKAFLLKSQAEGTLPTMESLGLGVPANKKRRRDWGRSCLYVRNDDTQAIRN
jgi:hypothetical protein